MRDARQTTTEANKQSSKHVKQLNKQAGKTSNVEHENSVVPLEGSLGISLERQQNCESIRHKNAVICFTCLVGSVRRVAPVVSGYPKTQDCVANHLDRP